MSLRTSFFTIGGGDESNWTMMTHPDLSDGDAYLFPSTTHNLLVYNARGTKIFKTDLTNITFLADLPVSYPDGVCYNNATNQLVLLDEGWYKDTVSYVSTDTNLSTYTTGALPTDAYRTGAQLNSELIYGNGYYVIGGEYNPSSSARQPAIFYSTNGISWTRLIFNTSTSITTGTVKVVGFGNNKFVAFGSYFTGTTDYSSKAVAGSTPTSWTKAKSDFSGHVRISGHKVYGPKGIGALYINQASELKPTPIIRGGGQQSGYRSGTMPTFLVVGMGEAFGLMKDLRDTEAQYISDLRTKLLEGLRSKFPDIKINGTMESRHPGNLNVMLSNRDARDMILSLQPKIAFSTGSACTSGIQEPSHVLKAIGLTTEEAEHSFRITIGRFSNMDDINTAIELISGRN